MLAKGRFIMVNRIVLNTVSYHGSGAVKEIGPELSARGFRKALICSGKHVVKSGEINKILDPLKEAGIDAALFTDIKANPTIENVQNGVKAFQNAQADCIIAVGGGSVMDTAKAIGVIINNPEFADVRSLEGVAPTKRHAVFTIAVPTTAGTGSEATLVAVVANPAIQVKMEFLSYHLLPDVAVLDPRMTETLPPRITAATGFDALVHAIEAATCLQRNPVSDSFAEKAIQQISQNLTRAVEHGKDRKARMAMANGSLLAGAAFSNSMVGLVHAIGHALGGVCHVAHGEAMTILLPAVMKYNLEKCHKRYGELLLYVAGPEVYAATPEAQRAQKTIDTLIALRQHLADVTGLPTTLSQTGKVQPSDFEAVANTALNDGAIIVNPAEADFDEIVGILKEVWA